jgi:hypothetical protein
VAAIVAQAVAAQPTITITPTQPAVYTQPVAAVAQPAVMAVSITQPGVIGRWVGHVGQSLAVMGQPRAYLPAMAPAQAVVYQQTQAVSYQPVTAQPVYAEPVLASPQHPWKRFFGR